MKGRLVVFGIGLVVLVFALLLTSWTLAQGSDSGGTGTDVGGGLAGSDSSPEGPPEVVIPDKYQVPAGTESGTSANGSTLVYFTPQDENTSTTVLFLYNTGTTDANVAIQTFQLSGSLYINTSVAVPAGELVRICGDTVSSVSATWQDVVLVNFTTFSTYGTLELPDGVKAEAYVVWNNGSTYDPLQLAYTLPIRFSTDPATVFLPAVQRDAP
jgi:hypothetical protein